MPSVRPAEMFKEWGKEMNWGGCRMLPTQDTAHVGIHADFTSKDADKLRRFAAWMMRAADYLEQSDD